MKNIFFAFSFHFQVTWRQSFVPFKLENRILDFLRLRPAEMTKCLLLSFEKIKMRNSKICVTQQLHRVGHFCKLYLLRFEWWNYLLIYIWKSLFKKWRTDKLVINNFYWNCGIRILIFLTYSLNQQVFQNEKTIIHRHYCLYAFIEFLKDLQIQPYLKWQ